MKKNLLRIAAGIFLFAALMIPTSCELGDDCAWCTQITQKEGEDPKEGFPFYFCDETLYEKQSSTPVTILKTTTYWECD